MTYNGRVLGGGDSIVCVCVAEWDVSMCHGGDRYMGFHPQQALTRDGTVCYSGWGMRKWPTMYWQMQKGARAGDGVYWQKDVVPWAGRRKDFDSAWVQGNCLEVQPLPPSTPSSSC